MSRKSRLKSNPTILYTHCGEVNSEDHFKQSALGADAVVRGTGIVLEECTISRSTIVNGLGIQVWRSRLETIDAANAELERSGWIDLEVSDSRFTGARMNSSHIRKSLFRECRMNLMQCQQSNLQEVRFEKCDLRGAYFNMSSMEGTVFEGSDLTGADLSGARIAGCDFRRAIIEDIRVAPDQMRGVTLTADQALYLARLFGLDVQE